jgi:predicted metal-dependent hydrolase
MVSSQRFIIGIFLLASMWSNRNDYSGSAVAMVMKFPSPVECRNRLQTQATPNKIQTDQTESTILSRRLMLVAISTLSSYIPNVPKSRGDVPTVPASIDNIDKRGGRPFAPLSALLPAARLKLYVDKMYSLSVALNAISKEPGVIDKQYKILEKMNEVWINCPPLIQTNDVKRMTSSRTNSIDSSFAAKSDNQQYRNNRNDIARNIPSRITSQFNEAGVKRQWGILKSRELKLEQQNELRAALNYYTSQLEFSASSYTLTATAEKRKQMIRNDQLPSPTTVITSDLDLRDLYRNDFLTHIEDAVAEVKYQLSKQSIDESENVLDVSDAIDLMDQAHTALSKWFDLISPVDVIEAMESIARS